MQKVGDKAPNFELFDQSNNKVSLESFKGKKVVLYFYPKDDTPGCTKEACDLRDNYGTLQNKAVVLGVSADSVESHKKFQDKYHLPFTLLADIDKDAATKYGTWAEKSMFGKKYMGMIRATFLIDENGIIQKVWPKVSVLGHASEILKELD